MKKILITITALVLAITLSACNQGPTEDKNIVYVTVYPMQYLVEEIAGDTVEVRLVVGTSSHTEGYTPTGQELIKMSDADLLFFVNGGADSYILNIESTLAQGNVEMVDMSEHIVYNEICLTHTHDDEEPDEPVTCNENSLSPDPHFWLDPIKMIQAAEFVKSKLISTFPENTELYNNKYTNLSATLEQLNLDFQEMADSAVKPIMTTVRLFTYWEERYDIEIISITSDIHSTETNPGDIIELAEEAVFHGITTILFEKNANSPAGDQVLEELKNTFTMADKLYLHGLGVITADEVENGSNYISIMYDNLEVLRYTTK
ncbi:High-affinity zinc uptake system binding-protein ZnuA precursor [Candidatus Izimaplasma bacterium HR1]|jgi:zinc transport system substrate-binding protein|uniref:metal ABC transporter substrate-binding protein n=1 Tax=Candidatus Izimoplasma sp. HR1 TaxID=1541959 RepID=UPI0004F80503|nr:High-affinity zinc uptake system binding-protein ZnuA precursor [Candidatus Izimaplasma bacterium HR1]